MIIDAIITACHIAKIVVNIAYIYKIAKLRVIKDFRLKKLAC